MDKMIRFINSKYEDLFKLPDGGVVEVTFPDRQFSVKCSYIDNYHLRFGNDVLHICQLAEMVERGGGSCRAEPVNTKEQAAWEIGGNGFLAIQVSDEGYDYTLYDRDYEEIDGGQIDDSDLTMNQVRNEILEDAGLSMKTMTEVDYEDLMESVDEREQSALSEARESVLQKLYATEPICPNHPERKIKEETR